MLVFQDIMLEEVPRHDETDITESDPTLSARICVGRSAGCPRREPQALASDISLNLVMLFCDGQNLSSPSPWYPTNHAEEIGRMLPWTEIERLGAWPSLRAIVLGKGRGTGG